MPRVDNAEITRYYDLYSQQRITFTQEVQTALGLRQAKTYLQSGLDTRWSCFIYASSMTSASLLLDTDESTLESIAQSNKLASVYCFMRSPEPNPEVSIRLNGRIGDISKHATGGKELFLVELEFTQRPPVDYVLILGRLLETRSDSKNRKEDRVMLTSEVMQRLGLASNETAVYVENVPRKCFIRDLSISGASILVIGIAKFLINKRAILKLRFSDGRDSLELPGTIAHFEPVEGRKDIIVLGLKFEQEAIPVMFSQRLIQLQS